MINRTVVLTTSLALTACASEPRSNTLGAGRGSSGGGEAAATSSDTDGSTSAAEDDGSFEPGSSGEEGGLLLDVGVPDNSGSDGTPNGEGCQFIDVLFVVDISASMLEEKANLAANFPAFVSVLDAYVADGNALGYRLGVTNSSINADHGDCQTTMGFDGVLTATGVFGGGDCGTGGVPWLDGPAPGIAMNFSCLAENPIPPAGGSDCGHERPLGVMERFAGEAVPGGANEGFYRGDDALLVVVNLTDEDEDQEWTDTTPAQTKAVLDGFAGGEERYVAVTIAGPMACESQFGQADHAVVLEAFTDLVPNGLFGNICEGDLAAPLADALELIQTSCDSLPPPEG